MEPKGFTDRLAPVEPVLKGTVSTTPFPRRKKIPVSTVTSQQVTQAAGLKKLRVQPNFTSVFLPPLAPTALHEVPDTGLVYEETVAVTHVYQNDTHIICINLHV